MLIECESGKTEMDMGTQRARARETRARAHTHTAHGKTVETPTRKPISPCDKITI